MSKRFAIGDHVTWNSEAGHVSGTIIAIHASDFDLRGMLTARRPKTRNTRSRATRPITSPPTRAALSIMHDRRIDGEGLHLDPAQLRP